MFHFRGFSFVETKEVSRFFLNYFLQYFILKKLLSLSLLTYGLYAKIKIKYKYNWKHLNSYKFCLITWYIFVSPLFLLQHRPVLGEEVNAVCVRGGCGVKFRILGFQKKNWKELSRLKSNYSYTGLYTVLFSRKFDTIVIYFTRALSLGWLNDFTAFFFLLFTVVA